MHELNLHTLYRGDALCVCMVIVDVEKYLIQHHSYSTFSNDKHLG